MKINPTKKRNVKARAGIIIAVLLLAAAGFLYYAHHFQTWPFQPKSIDNRADDGVNYSKPTSEQSKIGNDIKEKVGDTAKSEDTGNTGDQPSAARIPITITAVQPGPTVYIRANIERVSSTGVCKLTMNGPSSKTYSASAPTQPLASSSTCQGFNVPMSNLTPGVWKISITVEDGSATGTATTEKTL